MRRFAPEWLFSNTTIAAALIGAGAVAFLTTWFLMSPLVERVDRVFLMAMIVGNIVIAAGFALLVGLRLYHVWINRRNQLAGSRTHMQLVGIFSLLAVVPAVIAFLFAFTILRASLNDVFSERIENYQETARDLANALVNIKGGEMRQTMSLIAQDIARQEEAGVGFEETPISFRRYLYAQAQVRGLSALYLVNGDGRIMVRAEIEQGPYGLPANERLTDLRNGAPGEVFIFGVNNDETFDMFRGALRLDYYGGGFLIGYQPVDTATTQRLFAVRDVREDWREAELGRSRLERVFLAGYVVLAIIILFGAIWLALWAATRLVQPIGRLVNMAEKVSSGDLGARVEVYKEDGELGALARSMNHMTAQLQTQRDDLVDTNRQFDERRRFTEAVLSGVSAGVIGLEADGRITIANRSAADLIGDGTENLTGKNITMFMPELSGLLERSAASPYLEIGDQIDVTRHGKTRTLNVRIVRDAVGDGSSYVATFDDITQLIAAQRNAAWGDVARRIAHEIKNPLTPIQLSAERLRRKYSGEVQSNPEVFDRCTETIIRQVSDIGRMVDEFSSFARMPKPVIGDEDVRELVKAAVFPQKVAFPDVEFTTDAPETPVMVQCDGRLIVQAFSNLLKNAAESIGARLNADEAGVPGKVRVIIEASGAFAKVHIIDNGVGLPKEERHRLAEPYMTTRAKGTGLGLAIVKKVAEEHGGALEFEDDQTLGETGAKMTISLQLIGASENAPHATAAE
ncbi:PAS domain-containing sensor histidine kinase [Hyphococcus flavus]|uniref:histidine kinase n=1 Tax=Hyphococcus flavus TaxID=1866326 RepID=A0AAE9ZH79_9PROT|nr:PAS domain-containing sensor histidine kinase [Hyphococcus flavus]WDI30786.1 PAS domain-containing sensor histidine kinase [Hyphococcus flavus]